MGSDNTTYNPEGRVSVIIQPLVIQEQGEVQTQKHCKT